jgi:transcriptional regulator with XRE-family HTH domain
MAFGRRFKEVRAKHGASMNRVHLETHMSTSYLSKMEQDMFLPGRENLSKVLSALATLGVPDGDIEDLHLEYEAVCWERVQIEALPDALAPLERSRRRELLEELMKQLAG